MFGENVVGNGTILFVVISVSSLVFSCVCNPVVFWFHRKMKQNTPAIMFQILTANDFLTCIMVVPVMVYYLVAAVRSLLSEKYLCFVS